MREYWLLKPERNVIRTFMHMKSITPYQIRDFSLFWLMSELFHGNRIRLDITRQEISGLDDLTQINMVGGLTYR